MRHGKHCAERGSRGIVGWLFIGVFGAGLAAHGGITEVGPFTGSLQESWESLPPFGYEPGPYGDDPTLIMGGEATISHQALVNEPETNNNSPLNTSEKVPVVDEGPATGPIPPERTVTIEFATPIQSFGGYWGSAPGRSSPDPVTVTVDFYDDSHHLIDRKSFTYLRSGPGEDPLEWHGWASSVPIKSLTYSGDLVVNDSLQADPVPEGSPVVLLLAALGLVALNGIIRRRGR